jgi:hypothetical protein
LLSFGVVLCCCPLVMSFVVVIWHRPLVSSFSVPFGVILWFCNLVVSLCCYPLVLLSIDIYICCENMCFLLLIIYLNL